MHSGQSRRGRRSSEATPSFRVGGQGGLKKLFTSLSPVNDSRKNTGVNDAFAKRVRRHVGGRVRDYYAIVSPGFEACTRRELIVLGIGESDIRISTGGVTFRGRFVDCQRANLHLRTATRILMRIDTFTATNPRQLEKHCASIPWALYLTEGTRPGIRVHSQRSRLYHSDVVAEAVRKAIAGCWMGSPQSPSTDFPQTVFVRLSDDRVTLSLDSSGVPLYKRGLKQGSARAPLRESLAAAVLMCAGYDSRRPLVDPMCGSGTLSLEAAMMAKGMAPGNLRNFAFMGWPAFGERQWSFLKREADTGAKGFDRPPIHASDLDNDACEKLSGIISDNGLSDAVEVTVKDFFDCEGGQYEDGPGLVAINPPYGIRIGSTHQAADLFQRICRHLDAAFTGWDVALIVPERGFLQAVPFVFRQVPMQHGGLRLTLLSGTVGSASAGRQKKGKA
jgi:putative N6-adenine-specific DNA methylase